VNILQKAAAAIVRSIGLLDPELYRAVGTRPSHSGENVSTSSVLGLSAAWGCVNILSGTISSLPLVVYRTGLDGHQVPAKDHPLYRVLHDSPNADQTATDFWDFLCACIELQGNGFAEIERADGGRVIALDVPVPPEVVTVRRLSSGSLEYRWTDQYRRQRVLPQERVLHIRGFGGSPLGGLSTLSFGRQVFGVAQAVERAAGSTFANGVRPTGILGTKSKLNAPQRTELEQLLGERFQGAMNSGRPMLLDHEMTWQQLTINPDDAQMLESRSFSVEEICRFFGVPPFMVGHTEKSTSWGTGLEQQTLGFIQFTLRRRLKRIEQALEKQLLTPVERAQGMRIEFNLEGLLRGDSAARAAFYASGLQNGWRTINEVRATENLPPVAGGDIPRMQMQNTPINQTATSPTPVGG
jgi:HK97 family phage portal protein